MRNVVALCAGAVVLVGLAACRNSSMAAPTVLQPGDWPRFHGPTSDGFSAEKGLNKNWAAKAPKVLWTVPLSDGGNCGPSVAGGLVFMIDHEGSQDIVKALDFKTGAPVWKYAYADTDKPNYGFARSTPTFDQGRLYTQGRLGQLFCFNASDGKVLWQHNLCEEFGAHRPGWDLAASPLIDGDKVILLTGSDAGTFLALNKVTGEKVWQAGGGSEKPGYATPVIATINGVKQYVAVTESNVIGVNAADGKRIWAYPFKTNMGINAASPVVFGNKVFISAAYNHGAELAEVSASGAKQVWINPAVAAKINTPVYSNGFLYGVVETDFLVCVNAADGKIVWKQPGFEMGGVMAVDGTLIAMGGKSGDMVQVQMDPTAYKELGRITPLGGQCWAPPVLAHGKVLVRNPKALACVDLQ